MKKNIQILIIGLAVTTLYSACKKADPVLRNTKNGLADIYLTIPNLPIDDLNRRTAEPKFSNSDTVYFDVPYYYPVQSDNEVDLKKLLVSATIPSDSHVEPALGQPMDLTNPVTITVVAGTGIRKKYILVAKKKGDLSVKNVKISYTGTNGVEVVDGIVKDNNDIIFFILPGTDLTAATLSLTINKHATSSIPDGSTIDLTNPLPLTITNAGNAVKNYILKAQEPVKLNYGVGINRKLWDKSGADLGFTADNETSLAVSGNYLVVVAHNSPSRYRVFNRFTGAYVQDLPIPFPNMAMQVAADTSGNFAGASYTPVGSNFLVYRFASATDLSPVKLIDWVNTVPSSSPSWIGALGRAVNIYGDLNKDAIITATATFTNIICRWTVHNGLVVNNIPEQISYPETNNMGVWSEAQPTSTDLTANYFVDYQSEIALVNGSSNTRNKAFVFGWPVVYTRPMEYARFNNANYLAVVKFINTYSLNEVQMSLFDVTDPSKITLDPSSPAYSSLNVFTSDVLRTSGGAGGTTADVCVGFSPDKQRMQVYTLLTNGGIMAHEFTIYAP